jgi:hypothetical protein
MVFRHLPNIFFKILIRNTYTVVNVTELKTHEIKLLFWCYLIV